MSAGPKVKKPKTKASEPRESYTEEDKKTLNTIISSSKNGKFWKVLHGETSSNSQKHNCWEEIRSLFNAATGKGISRKQLRDWYSKLKGKEKSKHDSRVIQDRKLKQVCRKTGGGTPPRIPPDCDPDETTSSMFSQELDPVPTPYNKLSKPGPSASTLADEDNEYHSELWNEDLMTLTDGTPVIDSMGNPVRQIPRILQLPAKKAVNVPVSPSPPIGNLADALIIVENKENETPRSRKPEAPPGKRGVTSSEKNLPSKAVLNKKKDNKTNKTPSLKEGVNEFYKKAYSIQKNVSKHRIRLLKRKVNVEDIKIQLLKHKATSLGVSVPDNLFESDSSSDSDESSESEDYDPFEINM